MKQYVEGLNGEHARRQARRNSESAIAAKAFVNNAGYAGVERTARLARFINRVMAQHSEWIEEPVRKSWRELTTGR